MSAIVCHTCGTELADGHPARRGLLINRAASLGARIRELEWHLDRTPQNLTVIRELFTEELTAKKRELGDLRGALEAEAATSDRLP